MASSPSSLSCVQLSPMGCWVWGDVLRGVSGSGRPALSWKGPLLRLRCHCAGTLVRVDTVTANAVWVRSPTEKHSGKRFCGSKIGLTPVYFL